MQCAKRRTPPPTPEKDAKTETSDSRSDAQLGLMWGLPTKSVGFDEWGNLGFFPESRPNKTCPLSFTTRRGGCVWE